MRKIAVSVAILLSGCGPEKSGATVPGREIFDEFQSLMVEGDFEKLADRLDPEVLREFRRQLEFTTERPQEGSWFTGNLDRRPTPDELSAVTDSDFFRIYMKRTAEVIGNPLADRHAGGKLVTVITGSKGYRHFVHTKNDEYAFPSTFSFKQTGGNWRLVEPSVVAAFARQFRAAKGGTTR